MKFRKQSSEIFKMLIVIRVLIVSIITFILAAYFDIFEIVLTFVNRHEKNNFDEFFLVAIVVSIWLLGEVIVLNKKLSRQSLANQEFAVRDVLTGLNNRRGFFEQAVNILKRRAKIIKHTIVIYVDINEFKHINDTYGHSIGDDVLIRVAQELCSFVSDDDIVARIGGDEFVIMSNGDSNRLEEDYISKLAKNISFNLDDPQESIDIGLSFGVAVHPKDGATIDELLCIADKRMYEMKRKE